MKKLILSCLLLGLTGASLQAAPTPDLEADFQEPPESARPWVYWYFMDGNLSREGITADLEAMKAAGLGGGIFLEVGIGIPRGPVEFMSPPWRELFGHAAAEADRLGLQLALGAGPGWCGTGGPWVKPEQSMQHLVASETNLSGPMQFEALLPRPQPRRPYFGEATLTPALKKLWQDYYRDVAVLAFPTPSGQARLADADEKALYFREPYSSKVGVKPFLPAPASFPLISTNECLASGACIDLTRHLGSDGRLSWTVPPGHWTVLRFGRTTTGQTTRPAPAPGLGFESDKFERAALDAHFQAFEETLLQAVGPHCHSNRGLTTLHFDSWEMSSQNWSEHFRQEFRKRRGYEALPLLPALLGRVVQSAEVSERFLWDVRQTAQELVIENHAQHLKELGHRHGLQFSLEPYDLNPCADLELGAVADVPMCEFWSKGWGFPTEFSCMEAASLAHTHGRPIVGAEAFTADSPEAWRQYPGSMKDQADWALCCGINRLVFHRFQHQPVLGQRPGMTMGPYGVHWEYTQTWWDMVPAFHTYLSRCQQLLRRGSPVADILYLTPEGAPQVFRPPSSATLPNLPDRRGYNFDGCAPGDLLANASVKEGRIVFPSGMSYRLLVLPRFETMTPALAAKLKELVHAGATLLGNAPLKSPSLSGYPKCDRQVARLAAELWGSDASLTQRPYGKGRVLRDTEAPNSQVDATKSASAELYPSYELSARCLAKLDVLPDFQADDSLRYIHRREGATDFYFIGNREAHPVSVTCSFRVSERQPEWWNPVTGERRELPNYELQGGLTRLPLRLDAHESGFVLFRKPAGSPVAARENCPQPKVVLTLSAPWEVAFDPKWGGPEKIVFPELQDWSQRPEPGIKFYSGKAVYHASFEGAALGSSEVGQRIFVALGAVKNLASVRLNGKDLGALWCEPWRVEVPAGLLRPGQNSLDITVANLWPNRLIGDQGLPAEQRFTRTTWNPFKSNSPLLESGLLGPVTLQAMGGSKAP